MRTVKKEVNRIKSLSKDEVTKVSGGADCWCANLDPPFATVAYRYVGEFYNATRCNEFCCKGHMTRLYQNGGNHAELCNGGSSNNGVSSVLSSLTSALGTTSMVNIAVQGLSAAINYIFGGCK